MSMIWLGINRLTQRSDEPPTIVLVRRSPVILTRPVIFLLFLQILHTV